MSSKWGIHDKSFADILSAIDKRNAEIYRYTQLTGDPLKSRIMAPSVSGILGWTRESIKDKLIDVDEFMSKLDQSQLEAWTKTLKEVRDGVSEEYQSFQMLFDELPKGRKFIAEYANANKDGLYTTEGLAKANDTARQSIIAQNEALKKTTIGYKATTVAAKAFSMALNMAIWMAAIAALQAIVTGIQHVAHAAEEAKEELNEFNESIAEGRKKLKEQSDFINSDEVKDWEKLSKGVDAYGNSIYLSAEEMDKYHTISNKVADMFPDMIKGWDDQGNAVLEYGASIDTLNKKLEENRQLHYQDIFSDSSKTFKDYSKDIGGLTKAGGDSYKAKAFGGFIDSNFERNAYIEDDFEKWLKKIGVKYTYKNDENGNSLITVTDPQMQQKVVSEYNKLVASLNAETAKVKPLIELQAIQGVADAYNALGQAGYVGSEKSRARWRVENGYGSDLENAVLGIGDARENINKLIDELSNAGTTPTFKPSDNSSKSAKDAAKAQKDYDKKVKDINEQLDDLAKSEALEKLKYKFDQIEASITKIDDALGLLKTTLDLQAEDDYIGKIETVTYQMDLAQQKTGLLVDEFNQLKATTPTTADMAKEIADRMKSVTESIASNRKDMIDYAKSVTDYYMSAAKSIGSMSKDTLSKATSLFERNVKTLTEGGLGGLRFSITPTVPQSAYEKQRQDNQSLQDEMQEYYDAVAQMQKTALDMQYQEQIADNERKRQELAESLEEAKQTLNDALTEVSDSVAGTAETVKGIQKSTDEAVKTEQKDTNKKTSEEQKKDHSEKEAETENFSGEIRLTLTNLFDWIAKNPIKAPGLDTSSWDKMVSDAENYAQKVQSAASPTNSGINLLANTFDVVGGSGGDSSKAAAVVATAQKYLGTPYVWGGTSPGGFDCSGLVQYAYAQNGVNLSRTTYTQIKEGKAVSKENLHPGDLVFFGSGNSPSHVGMYVGNGQFIHAPHTGDVVKYSDLNSSYYSSHFMGARRILYAKGTQDFPVYGKKPNGVVSENHKPETIMHKKTGKTSIVDEPALIDTREYDIIDEKQTASTRTYRVQKELKRC